MPVCALADERIVFEMPDTIIVTSPKNTHDTTLAWVKWLVKDAAAYNISKEDNARISKEVESEVSRLVKFSMFLGICLAIILLFYCFNLFKSSRAPSSKKHDEAND
jgi:hypothetical protein